MRGVAAFAFFFGVLFLVGIGGESQGNGTIDADYNWELCHKTIFSRDDRGTCSVQEK